MSVRLQTKWLWVWILLLSHIVLCLNAFAKLQNTRRESLQPVLRWLAWLKKICFFMDWFYYNLIILIKSCKIPYKHLDKALSFSRNQALRLKMWKLWRPPTILQFSIFCWNFAHVFYLPVSTQRVCGILLDLELFAKIEKDLVSKHSLFTFFIKN